MKMSLSRIPSLFAVVALLALAPRAPGASITNATGGDFTNGATWVGGIAPVATDTLVFTNLGNYAISLSADVTSGAVTFPANTFGGVVTLDLGASKWTDTGAFYLGNATGTTNKVILSSGTLVVTNTSEGFRVGNTAQGNVFSVTNSATLMVRGGRVGSSRGGDTLTISGTSALLINTGMTFFVGQGGSLNSVLVGPGGTFSNVNATLSVGNSAGDHTNLVVVAGANARLTGSGSLTVGGAANANGNALVVSNGGYASVGGNFVLGVGNTTTGSLALVSGPDSWLGAYGEVRFNGWGSTLVVSNGATAWANLDVKMAYGGLAATSNALLITGAGSLFDVSQASRGLRLGSNSFGLGRSVVYVLDGGTLRANQISAGSNGTGNVYNDGGVYEFTTTAPIVDLSGTAGAVSLNDGVVAFRNVNGASLVGQVTNITYTGANTLRLDGSTNASVSAYAFGTGNVFSRLQLANSNALWQSTRFDVGAGGSLLVSNAVGAGVSGTLTNSGTIAVYNSTLNFKGNVVSSGGIVTDPSTVTYEQNLTLLPNGYINATNDTFIFYKNFINQSTNQPNFNLSQATVRFVSNGLTTAHTYDVSGSGSLDIGQGYTNFSQVAGNFAIGTLSVQAGNRLTITGTVGAITNAVYVGWLDIQGLGSGSLLTNSYSEVTNTLVLALNLPNINLFYDKFDTRNDWLTANLTGGSANGYDLWGGGLLLPIPEPSAMVLVLGGVALGAWLARRRAAGR